MVHIISFVAGFLIVIIEILLPGHVEPAIVMMGAGLMMGFTYVTPDSIPAPDVEREAMRQENVRLPGTWVQVEEPVGVQEGDVWIPTEPAMPEVTRDTDLRVIAKIEDPIERQVKRDLARLNA